MIEVTDHQIDVSPPDRTPWPNNERPPYNLPMIQPELLQRLRCPIAKQALTEATADQVAAINDQMGTGQLRDHAGSAVTSPIDGGLISQSAGRVYPIRDNIPSLVIEESIVWPANST